MEFAERRALASWLAPHLRAEVLTIEDVLRHAEGFSWETYTFTVEWRSDRRTARRGFALRREPTAGLLPPYDAVRDHRLHGAISVTGAVPMPRLRWLETDPAILGRPFYLMDRVEGIVPVPWAANDPRVFPDQSSRQRLGDDFIDVLAAIHTIDVAGTGIAQILNDDPAQTPEEVALAQVRRWARVAEESYLNREPLLDAAIVWLERNVATSGHRALVHGDYRIGNFMVGRDGAINAVFDWELAHIGDPAFDLAWAALRLYRGRSPLMSRLVPIPDARERYRRHTGLRIQHEVWRFWTVFGHLRAIAPHIRAARAFQDGGVDDIRLANMGHRMGYLLKSLAEELDIKTSGPFNTDPDDTSAAGAQGEGPTMQNTPDRLMRGAAASLRDAAGRLGDADPYVRSQVLGAAELLANLAPRIEWRAADLRSQIAAMQAALTNVISGLTDDPLKQALPRSRAVVTAELDLEHADVPTLLQLRDDHLAALREAQRWTLDGDGPQEAIADLIAQQLQDELLTLQNAASG